MQQRRGAKRGRERVGERERERGRERNRERKSQRTRRQLGDRTRGQERDIKRGKRARQRAEGRKRERAESDNVREENLKLMREYAPVPRRSATVPGSTYFIPQSLESTHSPNPESRLAFLTCMCAYNCVRFRCVYAHLSFTNFLNFMPNLTRTRHAQRAKPMDSPAGKTTATHTCKHSRARAHAPYHG